MRPNSGEVQESAEREALAKVIKHKGKDRQLDKTVIIKNTPEAFRFAYRLYQCLLSTHLFQFISPIRRVFGIKNVPKSVLDRMKNKKQLESFSRESQSGERKPKSRDDGRRPKAGKDQDVAAGTQRPSVFRGDVENSRRGQDSGQSQSNRQNQNFRQQQTRTQGAQGGNQDPSSGEALSSTLFRDEVRGVKGITKTKAQPGENWTPPGPGSSTQGSVEVENEIGGAQSGSRGGKSQGDFSATRGGVTRGRSPTPPSSVQILDTIKIEETLGNQPVIQPQLIAVNPNNPFLA